MASPYDYKTPDYLTEDDLKKIRRQKLWLGKTGIPEDTKQHLLQQRAREAGIGAIENIRSREAEGRMPGEKMEELKNLLMEKQTTEPDSLSRFADSPGMQAHLGTLDRLQEKAPDYNQLVEEEVTSKGLGQLPEVRDFLSRRDSGMAAEAQAADAKKTSNLMIQAAKELGKKPEYKELSVLLYTIAQSGDIEKYKDVLKNIGKAGEGEVTTEGSKDVELVKQFGAEKLQDKKQTGIMEKAGFDRQTKIMLQNLQSEASGSKFNDNEKKDAYKFLSRIDRDKTLVATNKAITAATAIKRMINSGSKLAPSVVEVQMPRMMGEVGNLAVQEQVKWRGSQAATSMVKRYAKKMTTGKMTSEDVKEINFVLDELLINFASKGSDRVDLISEQSRAISGLSEERFNSITDPVKAHYAKYAGDMLNEGGGQASNPMQKLIQKAKDGDKEAQAYLDSKGINY